MFWKFLLWVMFAGVLALPLGIPFYLLRPLYLPIFHPQGTLVAVLCYAIGLFWPLYLKPLWKELIKPVI